MPLENKFNLQLIEEDGVNVANFVIPEYGLLEMTKLLNFKQNNDFCDVCLVVESDETKVFAHKVILAMASEYFRNMFKKDNVEVNMLAPIKDITGSVLSRIVDFIYTGKLKIFEVDVIDFLKFSHVYKLPTLTQACEMFLILNLNMKNFLSYDQHASAFGCADLGKEVNYFIDKQFMKIAKSDALEELSKDKLLEILSRSSLNCDTEELVFDAVKRWVNFKPMDREQHLMELLKNVRFGLLSTKFISEHVNTFSKSNEALLYCLGAIHWHTLSPIEKDSGKYSANPRVFSSQGIPDAMPVDEKKSVIPTFTYIYNIHGIYSFDYEQNCWNKVLSVMIHELLAVADQKMLVQKTFQGSTLYLINLSGNAPSESVFDSTIVAEYDDFATCLAKDDVYFLGGTRRVDDTVVSRVFVKNIITGEIRREVPMTKPRYGASAVYFENSIYLIGGEGGGQNNWSLGVDKFDISTKNWTSVGTLNDFVYKPVCVINNDELFVIGAKADTGNTPVAKCFNLRSHKFFEIPAPPHIISSACVVNGQTIVLGEDKHPLVFNKTPDLFNKSWVPFKMFGVHKYWNDYPTFNLFNILKP